ncbi:5350_t:CDS:2 [Ambispora gerdemannii]|uniref:5350_t:CDS:1 n=1 Tax=Ambispora gerdemannii TaxID=144530 RepID=A0A9N8W9G3_9GLOM|nr:5350_t:CDS:2 [Ambispora gerdemannii]
MATESVVDPTQSGVDVQPTQPHGLEPGPTFSNIMSSKDNYVQIHAGHESQHSTMALILLLALFGFQFVILFWKQRHYRSFQAVTLVGLWLIPMYICIRAQFWRFLSIWVLYSLANFRVIYLASRKPLDHKTPRLVYNWFSIVYKLCYAVGVTGYAILMLTFFGILQLFYDSVEIADLGIILLSYGLYFGVLSRDFVEICTDRMASTLGYYNKDGFPRKHLRAVICAVCGGSTENKEQENVHQLTCRHVFHEECIRGWCLIGKKDICPYWYMFFVVGFYVFVCEKKPNIILYLSKIPVDGHYSKEKVDMKEFKTNPWDTQQQLYLSLLDGVRYLVVWQPIIFATVQVAYHIFGLE